MMHPRCILLSCLLAIATFSAVASAQSVAPARDLFRQHRYAEAQAAVEALLKKTPADPAALAERGNLLIRAWRLESADSIARRLGSKDVRGVLLHGRVKLLQKDFDEALQAAQTAQRLAPRNAAGYLLEADVHFWREKPDLAEAPLQRALELDPNDADARFAYGYAIWRRVDARQLPAMAEQWNRALEIDPLHYVTHWHFGNGHTHLTYADYAQPTDDTVRMLIRDVDSLVARERISEALARTREIEQQYPTSLLPALTRGSIFYMAYGLPRAERLDSAQAIFVGLLARKKNYGPAHNGLAAVIKQRQFEYVFNYDSLEAAIAAEPLPPDTPFARVFKDLAYYPGDRVERMARQQLGPSLAYAPFVARLGATYTVFPLHHDLTDALNNPFFRMSTTFDNRQWMDIRGSGGSNASAGIEYVERGSHQERVVLLHEYVHQWHGSVLTNREVRRIRELYHNAMANNRALDYYAANNESEFWAQSYEAYLTPVKVHPLNHKAMNTTADLIRKDPELHAFIDSLVTRNRAYLAGDTEPMRSNWAQVYTTLAQRARAGAARSTDSARWEHPQALVDTALVHDSRYLPAVLEQAALFQAQHKWSEAEAVLARAGELDATYAPTLVARVELLRARSVATDMLPVFEPQAELLKQALALEKDLALRADLNRRLRELYWDYGRTEEAIAVADEFARTAPAASTYLRDRRDEAAAFAAMLRSESGQAAAVVAFFEEMVARKPQHYELRAQAALALLNAGRAADAAKLIAEGQRILAAAGQARADYTVILASALAQQQQSDSAKALISALTPAQRTGLPERSRLLLVRVLADVGDLAAAEKLLLPDKASLAPRVRAERQSVRERLELRKTRQPTSAR